MEPRPLILAGDNDPHVEAVSKHLARRGVAPIYLNFAKLVEVAVTVTIEGQFIGETEIGRTTAIWNRRLLPVITPSEMDVKWKRWCEQEFTQAVLGALYCLKAHWVSDYFHVRRASIKTLQLKVAHEIGGLNIPEFIVTSNADDAQKFISKICQGDAIVKPLGRPVVSNGDSISTFFTNKINALGNSDWDTLKYAPCIFQRLIHKIAEIRVTAVGRRLFATRIDIESVSDVDYRKIDPYSLPHRPFELPASIQIGCLAVCDYFGLRFAAFDFLLDQAGVLHFLEVNPNGQWLWIEEITGQPISEAIAEELCTPTTN